MAKSFSSWEHSTSCRTYDEIRPDSASALAQGEPVPPGAMAVLQQAQPGLQPRLQQALEQAPADQPVAWRDDASGLGGEIVAARPVFDTRPCRTMRYTVLGGAWPLAVAGQRCREPDGLWVGGRVADSVSVVQPPSPLIHDLQAALRRLAYYRGAVDGVAGAGFTAALLAFEHDEQVPPEAEPTPALLDLAGAAIGRIPAGGTCPAGSPAADGTSLACGSIR